MTQAPRKRGGRPAAHRGTAPRAPRRRTAGSAGRARPASGTTPARRKRSNRLPFLVLGVFVWLVVLVLGGFYAQQRRRPATLRVTAPPGMSAAAAEAAAAVSRFRLPPGPEKALIRLKVKADTLVEEGRLLGAITLYLNYDGAFARETRAQREQFAAEVQRAYEEEGPLTARRPPPAAPPAASKPARPTARPAPAPVQPAPAPARAPAAPPPEPAPEPEPDIIEIF